MSLKRFCLVRPRWTLDDYRQHTCNDNSHSHLSKAQVKELHSHGALDWLIGSADSLQGQSKANAKRIKTKCVVKIRRYFSARGLSCSVGAELSEMLGDKSRRAIANAMLASIKMRSEEQRPTCTSF